MKYLSMRLSNRLPMTMIRLLMARFIYTVLHAVYRKDRHVIKRNGISYQVDLSEGIELSLFLFGGFQTHITQNRLIYLPQDAIILDIGANVGSMTLQFAKKAPDGFVFAFEATEYAFSKLIRNLELNPALSSRIEPIRTFVAGGAGGGNDRLTYASWKLGRRRDHTRHPLHGGTPMPAVGESITIDEFSRERGLDRIDLVKIDTDGHELSILEGAGTTVEKFRPTVVFEVGGYLAAEKSISFLNYCDYFSKFGYRLFDAGSGCPVTRGNWKDHIPMRSTTDIVALPERSARVPFLSGFGRI